MRDRTFDDAEVAGLEGGDLHRVLELGPTDLRCVAMGCQWCGSRGRVLRLYWMGPGAFYYLVGQGVAGEVAGVHVDGQELPDVEDPVRRYALHTATRQSMHSSVGTNAVKWTQQRTP